MESVQVPVEILIVRGLQTILESKFDLDDIRRHEFQAMISQLHEAAASSVENISQKYLEADAEPKSTTTATKIAAQLSAAYIRWFEGMTLGTVYQIPTFNQDSLKLPLPDRCGGTELLFRVFCYTSVLDNFLTKKVVQARTFATKVQANSAKRSKTFDLVSEVSRLQKSAMGFTFCPSLETREQLYANLSTQEGCISCLERLALEMILPAVARPINLGMWIEMMVGPISKVDSRDLIWADPKVFEDRAFSHRVVFLAAKLLRDLATLVLSERQENDDGVGVSVDDAEPSEGEAWKQDIADKLVGFGATIIANAVKMRHAELEERRKHKKELKNRRSLGTTQDRPRQSLQISGTVISRYAIMSLSLVPLFSMLLRLEERTKITTNPLFSEQDVTKKIQLLVKQAMLGGAEMETEEWEEQIMMLQEATNFAQDIWAQYFLYLTEKIALSVAQQYQNSEALHALLPKWTPQTIPLGSEHDVCHAYVAWKASLLLTLYLVNSSANSPYYDGNKAAGLAFKLQAFGTAAQLGLLAYLPELLQRQMIGPVLAVYKNEYSTWDEEISWGVWRSEILLFPPVILSMQKSTRTRIGIHHFDFSKLEFEKLIGFMVKGLVKDDNPADVLYSTLLSEHNLETKLSLLTKVRELTYSAGLTVDSVESNHVHSGHVLDAVESSQPADLGSVNSSESEDQSLTDSSEVCYAGTNLRQFGEPDPFEIAEIYRRVYQVVAGALLYEYVASTSISSNATQSIMKAKEDVSIILSGLNFVNSPWCNKLRLYQIFPITLRWVLHLYSAAVRNDVDVTGLWQLLSSAINFYWPQELSKLEGLEKTENRKAALDGAAMLAITLRVLLKASTSGQKVEGERNTPVTRLQYSDPVCPHCYSFSTVTEELLKPKIFDFCDECGMSRLSYQDEVSVPTNYHPEAHTLATLCKTRRAEWVLQEQEVPNKMRKLRLFLTNLMEMMLIGTAS